MVVQQKLYTAEEFWAMTDQFEADKQYELVEGVIVEMAASSPENTIIAGRVLAFLFNHVDNHDLGFVTGADGDYTLSPGDVRIPDVAYISRERTPTIPRIFEGAPDLAVEVISPGESPRQVHDKTELYLKTGARLVWNIYPEDKVVEVWQATGDGGLIFHTLTIDGVLDGGAVLPGFSLPVSKIFPA
jgi:Uma2 family endonuclease